VSIWVQLSEMNPGILVQKVVDLDRKSLQLNRGVPTASWNLHLSFFLPAVCPHHLHRASSGAQ